ncbi:FecR family protein [Pedobacter sp. PWIIR3]
MEINKDRAAYLADRWLKKKITPEEELEFHQWYQDGLYKELQVPAAFAGSEEEQRLRMLAVIESKMNKPTRKLWATRLVRITAAAAALTAIALGIYFFKVSRRPELVSGSQFAQHDIAPGRQGATITLANGKVIKLDSAKSGVIVSSTLKYNDNTLVSLSDSEETRSLGTRDDKAGRDNKAGLDDKQDAGYLSSRALAKDLLTASTAKGQTYTFTLPDGTRVWLNAASSIRFPSQFSGKERKVLLNGEAYFEVAKTYTLLRGKRTRQSFLVESAGQTVEVLGTHFNINSYKDEGETKTTLLEGSVAINNNLLKPNQQAVLMGRALVIKDVNAEEAIAWKNGKFVFNDETLGSIMRKVSRWYDVEVEYQGVDPQEQFWGSLSRFENVSKVLEKLQLTGKLHFQIKGRKIIVTK